MFGSVKTAVGSTSPEASRGSQYFFCSSVPPREDELGGDLGARAERADADVAARQLLGHDAHRDLAHALPAVLSGMVSPNTPISRILLDQLDRDEHVLAVDLLRDRDHAVVGELRELVAHVLERAVVQAERP